MLLTTLTLESAIAAPATTGLRMPYHSGRLHPFVMYQFNVSDMTCGHCAGTITQAVKAADPKATVEIDLARHLVKVESALAQDKIAQQIAKAGYTPAAVA